MISHQNWKRNWGKNREKNYEISLKILTLEKRICLQNLIQSRREREIFFKHSNFERRTRKVLGNPFPLPSRFPSNIAIEVGFPITIIFLVENRFSNQSAVLKKPQRATQQWLSFLQLHFASLTGVEVLHQFWARSRFTMPTNENTFWRLLMHPTLD